MARRLLMVLVVCTLIGCTPDVQKNDGGKSAKDGLEAGDESHLDFKEVFNEYDKVRTDTEKVKAWRSKYEGKMVRGTRRFFDNHDFQQFFDAMDHLESRRKLLRMPEGASVAFTGKVSYDVELNYAHVNERRLTAVGEVIKNVSVELPETTAENLAREFEMDVGAAKTKYANGAIVTGTLVASEGRPGVCQFKVGGKKIVYPEKISIPCDSIEIRARKVGVEGDVIYLGTVVWMELKLRE